MKIPRFIKNHFLVTSISFGAALLLILFFIIFPSLKEINKINNEVFQERSRLETLYAKGQLQKKVLSKYNEIKDDALFLDEIVLKENQELQYITTLENLAETTEVNLDITIAPAKENFSPKLSALSFSFVVTGNWQNLLRWLDELEKLPYYTHISEVNVVGQSNNENNTSLKIKAKTFWLK